MDEQMAYEFGRDCEINGANTSNCNFAIFSRPEYTKAWEKGKKEASASAENKNEK